MASNYLGFPVTYESEPGVMSSVGPDVEVIIYHVEGVADVDTVTTDADGLIAANSVDVPVGDTIRFRVENFEGRAFSWQTVTTS